MIFWLDKVEFLFYSPGFSYINFISIIYILYKVH